MRNGANSPFSLVDQKITFCYNYYTMKKAKKVLVLKHRAHSILFERELPFRPKKEVSRVLYKRNTKHRNKHID
jgi:hypothetical protein